MSLASFADARACSPLRSAPPAPSRKIADSFMPAACALRAASTWSAAVAPFAIRFSVTSSPDSGPMYSSESPSSRRRASSSGVFSSRFIAVAYALTRRNRGKWRGSASRIVVHVSRSSTSASPSATNTLSTRSPNRRPASATSSSVSSSSRTRNRLSRYMSQ